MRDAEDEPERTQTKLEIMGVASQDNRLEDLAGVYG